MRQSRQLAVIVCLAIAISSAMSHIIVKRLGIRVTPRYYRVFGPQIGKPVATLYGSSTALAGLNWSRIAEVVGGGIAKPGSRGSSPSEEEVLQRELPSVRTFIVTTAVDLNEYNLSDFRAAIVPFRETIQDLWHNPTDRQISKRILSQYPIAFARTLFPTIGRSDGFMVGIRGELLRMLASPTTNAGAAPQLDSASPSGDKEVGEKERVSEWTAAHLLRQLVLMKAACQGRQSFDGPKKRALLRMVRLAGEQGKVTVIVMPMSPYYEKEFLTPGVMREFEQAIDDVQCSCPGSPVVRLDLLNDLRKNDLFSDFVHMNIYGQRIATQLFLTALTAPKDNQ